MPYQPHTTISAIATPPGQGAIGIIRVSGPDTFPVMDTIFHGTRLSAADSHTAHFGTIRDGNRILDEVLVTVFKNPRSYTGEDVAEISCHGSAYILQSVLDLLSRHGIVPAQPGEFTLRAFLHGKMDLSQAEAVADLIASGSEASHKLAMQQMRGGFSNQLQQLRTELVNFASLVELELDFSEEDVEFANRDQLLSLVQAIQKVLAQLIQSFQLGNVLKNGVATVIAGRPNAGKSTLLNALIQEERAIVSDIPGTTRDTIEELINIDGVLFRLIDTAGIRDASDKIEAIGVGKTMEQIKRSALVVYLFDLSALSPDELLADIAKLEAEVPVLVIGNKRDLVSAADLAAFQAVYPAMIAISSLHHENLEGVHQALLAQVQADNWKAETTIVSNARHVSILRRAQEGLVNVQQGIDQSVSGELLALDIRTALDALGEITGTITSDDLLGNIFGKFCIGK